MILIEWKWFGSIYSPGVGDKSLGEGNRGMVYIKVLQPQYLLVG
jgi:hypothetical protein